MEIIYSLSEINEAAKKVLAKTKSKTILFYGEMGVGKTTLIRALVKTLGANDNVSSPTFSLVNEYEAEKGKIHHFDFYRIENETEAFDIGLEEYLDSNSWNFIEWPEKIPSFLDPDYQIMKLSYVNDGDRKLILS